MWGGGGGSRRSRHNSVGTEVKNGKGCMHSRLGFFRLKAKA